MTTPRKSIIDETLPFASSGSSTGGIEPDFEQAFHQWKGSDTPVTRGALLKTVQPIIGTALHSYTGGNASPAVKSQAKLMALKAFHTYDPAKGNMKTHLLSQLRGLQRAAAQSQQIISIPERVSLDRQHLMAAENELRDNLGREPSDLEVADYTGLSLKRLGYIRQVRYGVNSGSIMDEEGEVFNPASTVPGAHSADDAWADMIYYDLNDTDRAIMDYTLGMRGAKPLSTTELAIRLGISPGAVSQRKAKIQGLLDQRYQADPFGGNNA